LEHLIYSYFVINKASSSSSFFSSFSSLLPTVNGVYRSHRASLTQGERPHLPECLQWPLEELLTLAWHAEQLHQSVLALYQAIEHRHEEASKRTEVGVQPGVQEEEPMCIFEGGLVEDEEGELASRGSKPAA